MEVITLQEEAKVAEEHPGREDVGSLYTHFGPTTFRQKVERVAPWLATGCMEACLELDTRNNLVHAYVEAHYVPDGDA